MKAISEFKKFTNDAESAVRSAEQLQLGAVNSAAVLAAAPRAIEALEAEARRDLFPIFVAATPDAVSTFDWNLVGKRAEIDQVLIAMHIHASAAQHPVAELIRSVTTLSRIEADLLNSSVERDAVAIRLKLFVRAIAAQMTSKVPAAAILADTVPAFEARLNAVEQRHRDHAAELKREADAKAAKLQADKRAKRVAGEQELRDLFSTKFGRASFNYSSGVSDWSSVATILTGAQFAQRVLEPESATGLAPDWRVRQAIGAIKTVDPDYDASWFIEDFATKAA